MGVCVVRLWCFAAYLVRVVCVWCCLRVGLVGYVFLKRMVFGLACRFPVVSVLVLGCGFDLVGVAVLVVLHASGVGVIFLRFRFV